MIDRIPRSNTYTEIMLVWYLRIKYINKENHDAYGTRGKSEGAWEKL